MYSRYVRKHERIIAKHKFEIVSYRGCDESNLGFWIGLGSIALGGAIACGILFAKRKKDDDSDE